MAALLRGGASLITEIRAALDTSPADGFALADVRLLAPIANPPKIICAWVNYPNPAVAKMPETPIFFSKYASAIVGPDVPISLPLIGDQIVVEPELAAVIGTAGKHIQPADALSHIAGYTIVNDVTAFSHRLQVLLGSPGPYMMAKTFDSFAPCGPCIVTSDAIPDPHSLVIRQWLNGELQTRSNTSQAIFKLPELISYVSGFFALEPGDLILTGSPPPDGPLKFLSEGDQVSIEIEGIGRLENPVVREIRPA
jgi:2-keto-4-pentenoate hydratase/2-oxohepta-3-ene-1,7-dioic acid hydratase in catechol pathway